MRCFCVENVSPYLSSAAAPMAAETECNSSSLIEYSDLCLRDDPPSDCYPSVKVGEEHLLSMFLSHTMP